MYGTVARLKLKPGQRDQFITMFKNMTELDPGEINAYVVALDADPDGAFIIGVFESKEAHLANAKRPETHERYLKLREMLASDPEWNDGEILGQQA